MPNRKIHVSDLAVYFGGQPALTGVTASFAPNRIHVITGPSGSGKSTFLRSLNRLNESLGECRTEGEILMELQGRNCPIDQLKEAQLPSLRQKVGMVFQHPQLLPGTIEDNLLLPLKLVANTKGEQAQTQMSDALKQTGLWHEVNQRLRAPAQSLSGGQQQRLCLARTLAMQPEVLLLDEPTASLDPAATAQIEELLNSLKQRFTLLVVTHNMAQANRLADRQLAFDQGKLITD
ncbi:ATP-binding cassette domain-containing protein [Ferrimonas sp. YFM]|uniref:phosphate ABC transporter ATP-binding protein n=1 Tax=Ferrimonas sp. YFM TaxID=3028878 RepID=UPI002572BD16|nr:ATP-binding cassette domain-containing protein [Ferrimonas sp. YFM]BDY06976.1 phosphate import ATP-binding protein PstB 2 [Ferrimonas sp. YFM]